MNNQQNPFADFVLSHGKTIAETEADLLELTRALYADAFRKGNPMFYRDERVRHSDQFVRANPDGSEDLVRFKSAKREYTLLKRLVPPGQGYWFKVQ